MKLRRMTAAVGISAAMLVSGVGAASAGSRPDTPVLVETQDKGAYVSVKWKHDPDFAKVEIYRDSRDGKGMTYVTNVSGGNVLNDYEGDGGDIYQLIAYDADGALSHRSSTRTAGGESPANRNGVKLPKWEELEAKSPAKQNAREDYQDFRDGVAEQNSWASEEATRLEAEAWDREQKEAREAKQRAEAKKEKERFEREQRRLREEERRKGKSGADERQESETSSTSRDGSGGATRGGDHGDGLRG